MSEKRILHIVSGDLWAGKEAQLAMQLQALQSAGEDISVLLFNQGTTAERFEQRGLKAQIIEESKGFFNLLRESKQITRELSPQIVVAHGYKEAFIGAVCAKEVSAKFISTFHGAPEPGSSRELVRTRLYGFLHKLVTKRSAAKIICPGQALAIELGFDKDPRLKIVPNVTEFSNNPGVVEEISTERPAVVLVGRLAPVKDIGTALQALAEIPSPCRPMLYIVGDGPQKQELEAKAKELSLNDDVRFMGFRKDALSFINSSNMVLLTSLREGLPTVLLEAAACGTPIVSSALPGVIEAFATIKNYPIEFCEIGNPESFATAILRVLSNEALREEGDWTSLMQEKFSPEAAAKSLSQIYRELRA